MERTFAQSAAQAWSRLLGASGANPNGRGTAETRKRRRNSRAQDLAVPRVAAGTAAGIAVASSADSFSQERSGLLDGVGTGRRKIPAGAAHDSGHRAPDVAPAPS